MGFMDVMSVYFIGELMVAAVFVKVGILSAGR